MYLFPKILRLKLIDNLQSLHSVSSDNKAVLFHMWSMKTMFKGKESFKNTFLTSFKLQFLIRAFSY